MRRTWIKSFLLVKAPSWARGTSVSGVEDDKVLCRGSEKLGMRSPLRCFLDEPPTKLDVEPDIVPNLRVIV